MNKIVEINRIGINRVNGEIRNRYVISIQINNECFEHHAYYTSEYENYRILRREFDGSIIERDIIESARGATFGEPWPFLTETEQARKAQ